MCSNHFFPTCIRVIFISIVNYLSHFSHFLSSLSSFVLQTLSILYILHIATFICSICCKYFLPVCQLSFYFIVFFSMQMFMWSDLNIFFYSKWILNHRKSHLIFRLEKNLSMFSSDTNMVLLFICISPVLMKTVLLYYTRYGPNIIFSQMVTLLSQYHSWKCLSLIQ